MNKEDEKELAKAKEVLAEMNIDFDKLVEERKEAEKNLKRLDRRVQSIRASHAQSTEVVD
ncbi:MAG: hypothetical protein ACXAEF_07110 [Candidatus Thorarchaeota archaeon]